MRLSATIKLLVLLLLCCGVQLQAQSPEIHFRVRGTIIDARTQKPIKRIPIIVQPFNQQVNADSKGAFLFNMPVGSYSLVLDYYPFDKQEVKLNVKSDTMLVIKLHSPFNSQYIDEVEVRSSRPATENPAAIKQIDKHMLKVLPAMIGERDILKALALTSGVTSSSEGAADMQVRGGMHGQNLYLLDNIPLYSTEHFFGLVSVYNPVIIKSAQLYKSAFPAEYGGKISSVVNVQTDDASMQKFRGEAEIGILTSKLALNVPLAKDKLALTVAGRVSNYSIINLISPLVPDKFGVRFGFSFGDINSNLVWKLSEKDRLKLTFFSNTDGIDVKNYGTRFWIKNNQQNLGLNWYNTISNKAENHLLGYVDNYGYDFGHSSNINNVKQINQILTGVSSAGLVDKFNYQASDKMNIVFGGSIKGYGFSPYQINQNDSNVAAIKTTNQSKLTEGVIFAEGEYYLKKHQFITLGMRLSIVGNSENIFINPEPRMSYHGIFKNDYSLSISAGRMTQPVHRAANSGLGFPFEMFLPSSVSLLPETSWNFSVGGAKDFSWKNRKVSVKADLWYKSMKNIVEFQDGYDAVFTTILAPQSVALDTKKLITQGKGMALGIDLSAEYSTKIWKFTADYTLMKAESQFADLNGGRSFASPTDIRNSLSLTSELKLSDSWSFSATWQYRSGKPITVPTYIFANPLLSTSNEVIHDYDGSNFQRVVTERNNYRTKPFHKLDISFLHYYKTKKHHRDATLTLGLYNAYNNANPYLYFIDGKLNADKTYTPVLKSISLFPILPSFSWSMKF